MKSFYDDELHIISSLSTTVSAAEHNNVTTALHQNSSQGSVNVTLSGPSAPNPVYLVQSAPLQQQQEAGRPHCINRVAHPVPLPGTISTIYPQLHHDQSRHDGPEPHFQVTHNTDIIKCIFKEINILLYYQCSRVVQPVQYLHRFVFKKLCELRVGAYEVKKNFRVIQPI